MCVRVLHTSLTTVINPSFSLGGHLSSPSSLARVSIPQSCKEDVFNYYQQPPSPTRSGFQWWFINTMHSMTGNYARPQITTSTIAFKTKRTLCTLDYLDPLKVCYKAEPLIRTVLVSMLKKIEEFMQPKNNTSGRVRVQSVCLWWNRPQTRADVRSWHVRQCQGFLQLTIIVYHRDDRQNLFRDLFMQIKSQVKCKYLLSSSPEWICQSFYQIFCRLNPCLGRSLGPSCS